MKRIFVLVASALVSGVFLLISGRPVVQAENPTVTPTMQPTPFGTVLSVDLGNGLSLENRQLVETSPDPTIKLSAERSYPELVGEKSTRVDDFNKAVATILTKNVDDFRTQTIESLKANPPPTELADYGSFVMIWYTVLTPQAESKTTDLVSIKFDVGWYYAGAAHPNNYSVSLNYDLISGKELVLADLFQPKAEFLKPIAAYCIAALKKADVLSFPEGADPTVTNYEVWNIVPRGLQITFVDYQVAPHAVGPQTVIVPWSELASILSSAWATRLGVN